MLPWNTGGLVAVPVRAPDCPWPAARNDARPPAMLASPPTLPIELWDMITPIIC